MKSKFTSELSPHHANFGGNKGFDITQVLNCFLTFPKGQFLNKEMMDTSEDIGVLDVILATTGVSGNADEGL